ncbi:MAG: DUF86 domain-containing protein [Patescibacteria group bacterium]
MKREFLDYVEDIIGAINDVAGFIKDIEYDDFKNNKKTVYAVIKAVEIIGEASKNIPDRIKEHYPKVPWKEMAGMRDKMTHEYFGANLQRVWETAQKDIPDLKLQFEEILELES